MIDPITGQEFACGETPDAEYEDPKERGIRHWNNQVEGAYNRCVQIETGRFAPPEAVAKLSARTAEIIAASHIIAQKLASVGIAGYRESGIKTFVAGLVSGECDEIPAFAQNNLIPAHAQSARKKRATALQYYLDRHPFARMFVFTNGPRCRTYQIQERTQALNRAISRLNAEPWFKEVGQLVCRSIEYGTLEKDGDEGGEMPRDAEGFTTFHPHAHCVFTPHRLLPKEQWGAFVKRVGEYWGHHWQESGIMEGAREIVKYITKPSAMIKLTPLELKAVYLQLYRARLFEFMGELKSEYRTRQRRHRKLRWSRTKDGPILTEIPDPNRTPKPKKSAAQKEKEELEHKALEGKKFEDSGHLKLCARLAPLPNSQGIFEPKAVFIGKHWDASILERHPLLREARAIATPLYEEALWAAKQAAALEFTHAVLLSEPKPPSDPPRKRDFGRPKWLQDEIERQKAAKIAREKGQEALQLT